jgi:hypothetical protein
LDRKYDIVIDLSLPDLGHPERPGLLEEVYQHYDPNRLYCVAASQQGGPACPGFMTIVKDRGKYHARHVNIGERVETEAESDLHRKLKEHTAEVAEQGGFTVHVEDRAQSGKRKTDVTIDGADRKIGVEVQLSGITRGSVDKRTALARADGLTPLWLVNDQNAMPIDRANWARLEVQSWRDVGQREALPVRGGVRKLEMVPCEWKGHISCPRQGGGRCGGSHGTWAPMGGLYYDDAVVQTAAGLLVPLYYETADGKRGWFMWVPPADKAEFLQGREEPLPRHLQARDVELPDRQIVPLAEDDECHWGEESDFRPESRAARDSGASIDASRWVSQPAPPEFVATVEVDGCTVPGDLIALKRDWRASVDMCGRLADALPLSGDVLSGKASISQEQRDELEDARADQRRLVLEIHRHPWWATVDNRGQANRALQAAAFA